MKVNDKVTITVDSFKGETGTITNEFVSSFFDEITKTRKNVMGLSFGVILDSVEKWNKRQPILFHLDEMKVEKF